VKRGNQKVRYLEYAVGVILEKNRVRGEVKKVLPGKKRQGFCGNIRVHMYGNKRKEDVWGPGNRLGSRSYKPRT